ncbi:MAG: DUF91 domain-containing protein [Thaumarchaeota archaeon]|nr:DUF91 domain-containing protein [Nitrososphaerota archaeon]
MLESVYLQTEGASVLIAIIAAVIICVIFFTIQRKSISAIKEKLAGITSIDPKIQYDVTRIQTDLQKVSSDFINLRAGLPHTNEVASLQENVTRICNDFTTLKTNLDDEMNKFRLGTTTDLNNAKDQMITTATEKVVEIANNHLVQNSISREEFDNLRQRIEKMLGAEEIVERMETLSAIFDTLQPRTLNWQCKLIKMLRGGLAPEAEEDQIVADGIPLSSYEKFLKKLMELKIIETKKVNMYSILPEFEWMFSYMDNPDWLQKRLEGTIKKEFEYQKFILDNLNLIEEGLLLEQEQYELATGKIDFICRDTNGKAVGLELKYPAAATTVKRQLSGYKIDYEQKTGRTDSRFILVSPRIPENLKLLLTGDGFEYREIAY